jgi:16S rRNA (cytosine967-C5)-methyltransferase
MPLSPARAAAFEILMRIETTDAYASELLHSSRFERLSPADHGLVTELVMGVLRWRSVLEAQITSHLAQPLAKFDAEVITALRMGAYQLAYLDRIPGHAAINESVELVKRARKRSAAGLVNAVLRKISQPSSPARAVVHTGTVTAPPSAGLSGSVPAPDRSPATDHAEFRAGAAQPTARQESAQDRAFLGQAVQAHPAWLVKRWEQTYGADVAKKICSYDQQVRRAVIRADQALAEKLEQEGIRLEPGKLLSMAHVVAGGEMARLSAFRERRLVIQDEASQLVALLVGTGKQILDCCAAPGGKTRMLAQQNPEARVVAMELHAHRAKLLQQMLQLGNVHVVAADARAMPFTRNFDRVLVDVPCTGTGTLARNPEIKWRLKPEDIARLRAYQLEILLAAMKQVSPGGRLLYSTCSLEPEENESVVEQALRQNAAFRRLDIRPELAGLGPRELLWRDLDSLLSGPYLRTIPGVHPCDGFFAGLLARDL